MDDGFPVLIDSVGSDNGLFSPPVPPTVEIDGIAASVFTDINTVTMIGAIKPLRVRQGVRGCIRGRHAVPRCGACAAPEDKAHHTKDMGRS